MSEDKKSRGKNEAGRLEYHCSWRRLVEDIYVHYSRFAREAAAQDREKQWQNRRGFTFRP